jgi:hypothetical protein
MGSSPSGGGGLDKTQKAINKITLERLEREESDLVEDEAERQRLLSAGRFGRTSLLTGGFKGPGSLVRESRAQTRSNDRAVTRKINDLGTTDKGVRGTGKNLTRQGLKNAVSQRRRENKTPVAATGILALPRPGGMAGKGFAVASKFVKTG